MALDPMTGVWVPRQKIWAVPDTVARSLSDVYGLNPPGLITDYIRASRPTLSLAWSSLPDRPLNYSAIGRAMFRVEPLPPGAQVYIALYTKDPEAGVEAQDERHSLG
jgi:hypothetical protein